MNNAVEIRKDGTVKFVKISETKKEKKSRVGDSDSLVESIREVVKEEMQKNQKGELDNMMESLNNIENQGGGGVCTVHSTTKICKDINF